jgi:hypothetical protein
VTSWPTWPGGAVGPGLLLVVGSEFGAADGAPGLAAAADATLIFHGRRGEPGTALRGCGPPDPDLAVLLRLKRRVRGGGARIR